MPGALSFLAVYIFWAALPPKKIHYLYWGLTITLLVAFNVQNALQFFVAFEVSLVPISLLILWGGSRPER